MSENHKSPLPRAPGLPADLDQDMLRGLLDAVLEEMGESVLVLDVKGMILYANAAAEQAMGLARQDLVGRSCADVEACDTRRLHEDRCPLETAAETGRRAEAIYTSVNEDGRSVYFRAVAVPLPGGDRPAALFLRLRQDITNRAARERRFRLSDKMAAIGELSTYIAHEIRNPLFAIGGFADALLRSPSLGEADRSKVGIIREESKRLDNILKSIINFARPMDAAQGEAVINEVARQAAGLVDQGQGRRTGDVPLDLQLDLDPADPRVRGGHDLLKQCLVNMLKNSLEAMPDGGIIQVRTRMVDDFVGLMVEDTGTGIPEDILSQVFNPFFSTKDRGAGLGLAMTKKIVEDMGGEVLLESAVGQGTTVVLRLPPVLAVDEAGPSAS